MSIEKHAINVSAVIFKKNNFLKNHMNIVIEMEIVLIFLILTTLQLAATPYSLNTFEMNVEARTNETQTLFNDPVDNSNTNGGQPEKWLVTIIPYQIDEKSEYAPFEVALIESALTAFERYTCIKFVKRKSESVYINIVSVPGECSSPIGYQAAGELVVRLGKFVENDDQVHCMVEGIVQHEIMHALGFQHEHNRPDRDQYVTIMEDNVLPNMSSAFTKEIKFTVDLASNPYDYHSIMHYGSYTMSKEIGNLKTIVPKDTNVSIDANYFLSSLDAGKINSYFQCNDPRNPCSFDEDMCGWMQEFKTSLFNLKSNDTWADDFDWIRTKGHSKQGLDKTPPTDHSGLGWFLLATSYEGRIQMSDAARIRTPTVEKASGTFCLTFYYFMINRSTPIAGTLNVYTQKPDGSQRSLIYTISGTPNGQWVFVQVEEQMSSPYQFVFEAVTGKRYMSDIGLDDVYAYTGSCVKPKQ